ncbi:MAG TPA: DUF6049 family protein, partial [Actinomycetes bacterium]|nr:DUF6049 family protein [Actinomycetes bacterium]
MTLQVLVVSPPAEAKPGQTTLTLTKITPVSVRPGRVLRISGRVSSDTDLKDVVVRLELGTTPFLSRSAVAGAASSPPLTYPVSGAVDDVGKVKANHRRLFTISIPAVDLPLITSGVYPMRIAVSGGPNAATLAQTTTFLPWVPQGVGPSDTRLLFFWPLIDQPRRDASGAVTVPGLRDELRPHGRLGTLTSAGTEAPVSWIIDPSLLADVSALPGATANRWLAGLPVAVGDRDVAIVPYGDPDMASVTAASRSNLLTSATRYGQPIAEAALERPVRTDLGWPGDGAADESTIDRAHRAGDDLFLLDERTTPLVTPLPYTPSGLVQMTNPDVQLLLADAPASAIVASPASSTNDIVLSRQRFLAETLLHTLELPAEPRLLVIAPPRRWNPDPAWARTLVDATERASWLKPITMDQATSRSAPSVVREPPTIPDAAAAEQLPT